MPYALLLVGAVMLVAGIRNTYAQLWQLVEGDFTQQGGFLAWVAAIAVIGALGYVPKLKPLSIALLTLILIVLVISHNGVFAQLQQFITSGGGAQAATPGLSPTVSAPVYNGTTSTQLSAAEQISNNLGNIG